MAPPHFSFLGLFRRSVVALVAAILPVTCLGSLTWESMLIQMTVAPGAAQALASFPFKNTGTSPVTLVKVQPDCGCTTVELDRRAFAPGETGALKVVFTLGDRVGLHEKHIQIITDEPSNGNPRR